MSMMYTNKPDTNLKILIMSMIKKQSLPLNQQ